MTRFLLGKVDEAREAVAQLLRSAPPHDSAERYWVELPLDDLLASISTRIDDAERDFASLTDEWTPEVVASARECVTLVRALIPQLRG